MAQGRQKVIEAAAAIRASEPRRTAVQAADAALRATYGLSDTQDGIFGTSDAAEEMGYRGQSEDVDLMEVIVADVAKHVAGVDPVPIRIQLRDTVIEVATRADDVDGIVEAIADSPALTAVLEGIAKNSYYSRFDSHSWQEMGKDTAGGIAQALFDGGVEAAEDHVRDLVDEYESETVEDHIRGYMLEGGGSGLSSLLDAVCDAIEEIDEDADRDEVRDAFLEAVMEELSDLVADSDESSPFDIIPSHVRVEVVNILAPKKGEFHTDELQTDYEYNVCGVGTIKAGPGLVALFERANVSFPEFVAHMESKVGVRLDAGRDDQALVEWLVAEDYLHKGEGAVENARVRADLWASFAPSHDPEAPAAVTVEDMFDIITESSYGGHPVHVSRMDLKHLVEHDWTKPMTIRPAHGYGERTGGFIGIFNCDNGSGHIELVDAPVTVPAGTDNWRVSGKWGYEVDSTFGIVGTHYYAVPTEGPAPEETLDEEASAGMRM
jgi:hypothetical protein